MSYLCGQFYFSGIITHFQKYQWLLLSNIEGKALVDFLPWGKDRRKEGLFLLFLDREAKDR